MDRDEILAKSRAENKNQDFYEQEILKQAYRYGIIVLGILATVFFSVQIMAGGGINYGIYAMLFSVNMTLAWVKFIKLRRKKELPYAILSTLFVLALSGCHIYNLIVSSKIW